MKRIAFLYTLALMFVSSCTNNMDINDDRAVNKDFQINSFYLELAALGENMSNDEIINEVYGLISQTRAFDSRIGNISIVDSSKVEVGNITTRSGVQDSVMIYKVYDKLNDVTHIVCGNRLYPFELASVNGMAELDNKESGVSVFLGSISQFLAANKMEINNDTLNEARSSIIFSEYKNGMLSAIVQSPTADHFQRFEIRTVEGYSNQIFPLVNVTWGQWAPYNSELDSVADSASDYMMVQPPVGCAPVAIAQILSAFQHPDSISFNGYTWSGNWSILTAYPTAFRLMADDKRELAQLMKIIGMCIRTTYHSDRSETLFLQTRNFFRDRLRFDMTDVYSYNLSQIKNSLQNNSPVYISGNDYQQGSHAWVIDGYRKVSRYKYYNVYECIVSKPSDPIDEHEWCLISSTLNSVTNFEQVHCNWGWDGRDNGYFESGVFCVDDLNFSNSFCLLLNLSPNSSEF